MTVRLIGERWGDELARAAHEHAGELRIICPFVRAPAVDRLLAAAAANRIEVITRFNLGDFARGVSDVAALRSFLTSGARIRGVRGLHAKVFIFGAEPSQCAAVTSANLTTAAFSRNQEFGCVSDDSDFVIACRRYFDELWSRTTTDLSNDALAAWDDRVTAALARGGRPTDELALPDLGEEVGDSTQSHTSGSSAAMDGWIPEARAAHVKFFGEGHNRAIRSTVVLDEVSRSGCHWACTYPTGSRPRLVQDGDLMFMGRLVKAPNDTMIYGRAIALAHVPGQDDASPEEIVLRPWKERWSHYVRVHHAEFLAGSLNNGIPLSLLMDELGSEAFVVTQEHARRGSGNVNPRSSLRQQPGVRLSSDGAAWLAREFDREAAVHGTISADDLGALDWSERG